MCLSACAVSSFVYVVIAQRDGCTRDDFGAFLTSWVIVRGPSLHPLCRALQPADSPLTMSADVSAAKSGVRARRKYDGNLYRIRPRSVWSSLDSRAPLY